MKKRVLLSVVVSLSSHIALASGPPYDSADCQQSIRQFFDHTVSISGRTSQGLSCHFEVRKFKDGTFGLEYSVDDPHGGAARAYEIESYESASCIIGKDSSRLTATTNDFSRNPENPEQSWSSRTLITVRKDGNRPVFAYVSYSQSYSNGMSENVESDCKLSE